MDGIIYDKSAQHAIQRVTKPAAFRDEFDDECIRIVWESVIHKNRKNPAIYRTEYELADKLVDDLNAQLAARQAAQKERQDDEILAFQHINLNE